MIKTFKIGESAVGGIIKVQKIISKKALRDDTYNIKIIDWDTKEVILWRYTYGIQETYEFLSQHTTHYWAETIVSYFKNKK